ncbi:hydantoinase/oxoprolinase family protein [Halomarina oriensis]|uniref:Hydantoinase/oxoprolinase family protein n=1 Tax=Halomarina oriensis TaxID=671145 RepID=A0A6B0GKS6_9EURY|nr:hydantoinase/oxoprolinase family protein [Halomarina oriensis]
MTGPRLGVDVGGTFTDVVLATDDGLTTAKVPSTPDQSEGVIAGVEKACERAGVAPETVESFDHATTVSTNALLEDDGARTALVTTAGFRDVLEIRRQDRPSLYDLDATLPDPLVPRRRRFGVEERATPEGIEHEVRDDDVGHVADRIEAADAESVAVCLLHAYAHPENERRVAEGLRERLDVPVSVSHEVLAEFREYERTATTAANAYVTPVIDAYLSRLESRATEHGLPVPRVMQSNGGVADARTVRERAVTTALSGPAAGVVGAGAADAGDLVTFDMGGTSSDVGIVRDGTVERTTEGTVADRPIRVPMVDVTTVGAGGGSVAWVDDGGALRVGPQSAGSTPGPACYGDGGTDPTVTDAALALGYLGAATALGGELALDADAAETVLTDLAAEADLDGPLDAARGVVRVVTATMTRAVRAVTVERGEDPREFSLVGFGGAGPMFAAALAAELGVERVVVPQTGGVLSAFGLLVADERHDAARTTPRRLADADAETVETTLDTLAEEVRAASEAPEGLAVSFAADCRYAGQSFELAVDLARPFAPETVAERFHAVHERRAGYRLDDPVELVTLRAEGVADRRSVTRSYAGGASVEAARVDTRDVWFDEEPRGTSVYDRERLPVGETLDGPAVCEQAESTVVVPPGWDAKVREDGALVLTRGSDGGDSAGTGGEASDISGGDR